MLIWLMKRRLPKLARVLAGIYLLWGLLVFFGSLGSESHSWWPIFLSPIIWPWGRVFMVVCSIFGDAPADYVAAVLFVIGGALWVWFLGRLLSLIATRVFPFPHEGTTS